MLPTTRDLHLIIHIVFTQGKVYFLFNLNDINQFLGSEHRHAMLCGNHSCRSFNISGRGRLEATRLHSKSVCWRGVPGVLRSGKL